MNRGAILVAALAAMPAGCNTVSGLGQDLQALGGAVSDTASDLQGGGRAQGSEDCTPDAHGRVHGPDCHPPTTDNPPPLRTPE